MMVKRMLFITIIFLLPILVVKAENRNNYIENITIKVGNITTTKLNDNNYKTYLKIEKGKTINLTSDTSFDSVYIIYYLKTETGTIIYNDDNSFLGKNGFLHEFQKLKNSTNSIDIIYDNDVTIKEIFVFNGNVPDWVQIWKKPYKEADIMLFSTHSDDEHLFFAGLIPKMIADGKKMQIVYLVKHINPDRFDEQLNGLWAVGLRNYPILGIVPDKYAKTFNDAMTNLENVNMTIDDIIKFQVDMIRRFKPKVVVGHDEAGEYGHGQHILNTYALKQSLEYVDDEQYDSNYEPFKPFKVYLHLYKKNPIIMDYDIPLDYFGGKTAYEMSKIGYKEHESQQKTWFTTWLTGVNVYGQGKAYNKITEIAPMKSPTNGVTSTFYPLEYGLYFSSVGYDNVNNDMFYNIPTKEKNNIIKETTIIANIQKLLINNKEKDNHLPFFLIGSGIISISLSIYLLLMKH